MIIFFIVIVSMLLNALPVLSAENLSTGAQRAGVRKSSGPRLFVDTDPLTAGIQSHHKVIHGFSFTVDIRVSGIGPSKPLDVYQFSLRFDPSVVRPVSIVTGRFSEKA